MKESQTPLQRVAPERLEAPLEEAPQHTSAVPVGPLQRRPVQIGLYLAAALAVAAITLPVTTGLSTSQWLRGMDFRRAYGGDNLRNAGVIAWMGIGQTGRALDAVQAMEPSEEQEERLTDLFQRLLAQSDFPGAFRTVQMSAAGPRRAQRLDALISTVYRQQGWDAALALLQHPERASLHDNMVATLIYNLHGADLAHAPDLVAQIVERETRRKVARAALSIAIAQQRPEIAERLLAQQTTPDDRAPLLFTLATRVETPAQRERARRALAELMALRPRVTPRLLPDIRGFSGSNIVNSQDAFDFAASLHKNTR